MFKNVESKMGFLTYKERDYWLSRILSVFGTTSPLLVAGVATVFVRSFHENRFDFGTLYLIIGMWVAVSAAIVAFLWFAFRKLEVKRAERVRKEHDDYMTRVTTR